MKLYETLPFLILLFAGTLPGTGSSQGGRSAKVQGRIEIQNPKVRLRDGRADAAGVVVWLTPVKAEAKAAPRAPRQVRMEQRGKRFIPHIAVIQVGAEVDFPNMDPFFHNVFSTFEGKTFDLGLYANGESRPVRFSRPGVSYIYCNIHPQMSAVIVTVDTPYFAMSAQDGVFFIENVPVGRYELQVWHERSEPRQLEPLRRTLEVGDAMEDLGVIRLDESAYSPKPHKNKHGEEYPGESEMPAYRRP